MKETTIGRSLDLYSLKTVPKNFLQGATIGGYLDLNSLETVPENFLQGVTIGGVFLRFAYMRSGTYKKLELNNNANVPFLIYAVMYRFLFVGWAIYRIIGIVFGVVIYMPYWLLTCENVVWKIDSYFDRICPRVY